MLKKQIEKQKKIESYIQKGLPPEEEDELWMEFLKEPDWMRYFETELLLRHYFMVESGW